MKAFLLQSILALGVAAAQQHNGSLQARIDLASAGDTIVVPGGVHEGDLLIAKPLVIIGNGRPVLRGSGRGSCVTITAPGVTVRGLRIERSGSDVMREDAGILVRSDGNTIADNEIHDVLFGIYLLESDGNVITRNTIVGRAHLEYGQRGSGIHVWNSHGNEFSGNSIRDARDGFYIQYANRTVVRENLVRDTRYGLHYMYADSNSFTLNVFSNNVAGAAIMYSHEITFRHNVFRENRGFASYGILFQDCRGIVADSNLITDNMVGMFFEATSGGLFRNNVIARNDLALQMFQNSEGNLFAGNNFIDNLNPLTVIGKRTGTRWGADGRGNHWSTYRGYDLDADGTGDVPMRIQNPFNYLEGRFPNIRLYLYSPASQALAVAAEAFPLIEIGHEVDANPLMVPADLSGMPAMRQAPAERRSSPVLAGALMSACLLCTAAFMWSRRRAS